MAAGGLLKLLRAGGHLAVDLIVPRRCALCGRDGPFVCAACIASLPGDGRPRCPGCLHPTVGGGCHRCAGTAPLEAVVAAYRFGGDARTLVHRLKYRRMHALAAPMGALIVPAVRALPGPVDVIVPVPLHPRRARARGFNQAEGLARAVAAALALPFEPWLLRRTRHTPHQVRQPDHAARQANMEHAFAAFDDVRGRRVLLVDDVATTGATLRACAAALLAAGAGTVQAVAFAAED